MLPRFEHHGSAFIQWFIERCSLFVQDLIPGVQVHSTPALEAVMDIRGDDNDEEDDEPEEKRKIEQKTDEEKEELSAETMPEVKDEGRRRKDRIVKVEEKKTIKLQRKLVVVETEPDTLKMEVEEGIHMFVYIWLGYCYHHLPSLMLRMFYCLIFLSYSEDS